MLLANRMHPFSPISTNHRPFWGKRFQRRNMFRGHFSLFLANGTGEPFSFLIRIVSRLSRFVSFTQPMSKQLSTPTWEIHHFGDPFVSTHEFPTLFHQLTLSISEVNLTTMNNTQVWPILLLEFLHERKSPTLTPFRPFPCDMNPLLDTMLVHATSPYVLFQNFPTFSFQLLTLFGGILIQILDWGVRTTFGGNIHMFGMMLINQS